MDTNPNVYEKIDRMICEVWDDLIHDDYDGGFLLREDSLKCAMYMKLRESIRREKLEEEGFRVYGEFYTGIKRQKTDLAIAKMYREWPDGGVHLRNCVEPYVILELKYRTPGAGVSLYVEDINKLKNYLEKEGCRQTHAYACFIDETKIEKPRWLRKADELAAECERLHVLPAWRPLGKLCLRSRG